MFCAKENAQWLKVPASLAHDQIFLPSTFIEVRHSQSCVAPIQGIQCSLLNFIATQIHFVAHMHTYLLHAYAYIQDVYKQWFLYGFSIILNVIYLFVPFKDLSSNLSPNLSSHPFSFSFPLHINRVSIVCLPLSFFFLPINGLFLRIALQEYS